MKKLSSVCSKLSLNFVLSNMELIENVIKSFLDILLNYVSLYYGIVYFKLSVVLAAKHGLHILASYILYIEL